MVLLVESMRMNRSPIAEPSVFTGDNINCKDWKALFMALTTVGERFHRLLGCRGTIIDD